MPASARVTIDPARAALLFAALGDQTRLRLVARLSRGGPQSTVRLARGYGITRQAVTKHLRLMEQAGLVRGARRGRERIWRVEPQRLAGARRHLDRIAAEWDATLQRLKRFVG
jgi:DNA-binding transcriptional ArsR family regulator